MPARPLPIRRILPVLATLFALSATIAPRPACASWPSDSTTNVMLTTGPGPERTPLVVPDAGALGGRTGAVVAYTDYRNGTSNTDVYAQHVLADGRVDPAWPAGGLPVCTQAGQQEAQAFVADGSGGGIVVWFDNRTAGNSWDLYAHHVLASGVLDPAWPPAGLPVSVGTQNQWYPAAVSDGSGGAMVVWQDERGGAATPDIYANHVLASGVIDGVWPANGRVVCNATAAQQRPVVVRGASSGVIVAWIDSRAGNNDVYAQRMNAATSLPEWTTNGVALCTEAGAQFSLRIATDGSGGAIAVWEDQRSYATLASDIYAQRVTSAGAVDPAWPVNGCAVLARSASQTQPLVIPDGAGGALVLCLDYYTSPAGAIAAQHLLASGVRDPLWPLYGALLCTTAGGALQHQLVSDGAGGLLACWTDGRTGSLDIYAHRALAGGTPDPRWQPNGLAVSTASGSQQTPALLAVDDGDAIAVWADFRVPAAAKIYAQRLSGFGALGTTSPAIAGVRDVPNDQGGKLRVLWERSAGDVAPIGAIEDYRLWRRVTIGATTFWEFLAQVPAKGVPGYSFMVSTAADSSYGSLPWNAFRVSALLAGGLTFYTSPLDSGYSVDNLSPWAPQQFVGEYANGTTTLGWSPSPDADVAAYRVYRGEAPEFAIGPASLVAEVTATACADAAGSPRWYGVTAVDRHGNEGPAARLAPAATTGAGPPGLPAVLALSPPRPNPARAAAELELALPAGARVSCAVFDVGGRLVRGLLDAPLPAGTHRLAWDTADERGAPVAGGLYFIRLEVAGVRFVRRLAVVR